MGSQKRSAREARRSAFERSLGDELGDVFAREDARRAQQQKQREEALRYKACERKKRYASRTEAEAAIRDCRRHGSRDLHCYQCPYCGGWHLTHKG